MLTVKAVGSLAAAVDYFEHEMDRDRDAPDREVSPADVDRQEEHQALEVERAQREAEASEQEARVAQDREQRETETQERAAREAGEREGDARREQEREAEREREATQERERGERDRQVDTSWQSTGVHAPDEEPQRGGGSGLLSWDDDDRSSQPLQIRAGGESAEQLWAAQDRIEHADAAALRADLREQYVNLGLTGSMADEQLEKLEEMIDKAAKLGERITISRDDMTGELVWNVHNAGRDFPNDFERLQFQDRLRELEHLSAEYGVSFARHDGPEQERVEFERGMSLREQAWERAGGGMDFGNDR